MTRSAATRRPERQSSVGGVPRQRDGYGPCHRQAGRNPASLIPVNRWVCAHRAVLRETSSAHSAPGETSPAPRTRRCAVRGPVADRYRLRVVRVVRFWEEPYRAPRFEATIGKVVKVVGLPNHVDHQHTELIPGGPQAMVRRPDPRIRGGKAISGGSLIQPLPVVPRPKGQHGEAFVVLRVGVVRIPRRVLWKKPDPAPLKLDRASLVRISARPHAPCD
jgi:hypothetical protein